MVRFDKGRMQQGLSGCVRGRGRDRERHGEKVSTGRVKDSDRDMRRRVKKSCGHEVVRLGYRGEFCEEDDDGQSGSRRGMVWECWEFQEVCSQWRGVLAIKRSAYNGGS